MFNCKMLQFTVYICYLSIYLIVPFTIIDYNKKILIFCINTFAFIKVIYNFNFLIPHTILNNLSRPPAATAQDGTSFVTTAPAAMIAPSSIATPSKIIAVVLAVAVFAAATAALFS